MNNNAANRMIQIDLSRYGLNADDNTINDVVEDADLEKLSPTNLVDPN